MALASLATSADLTARGIDVTNAARITLALTVASAAIRDAAGAAIGALSSTVTVPAPKGRLLSLPGPITEIVSVSIDGTAVTNFETLPNGIYRHCGWGSQPVPVTVEYDHGLAAVPVDIVDLTCQLAIAWLNHTAEGGGSTAGLESVKLDDAAESYTAEAAGQISPVYIPKVTRDWLAARFGGGVYVVETL